MTLPQEQQAEEIVETLSQIHQQTGHGWSRIFGDWIRIVFASLQRDDEAHAEIVDSYTADFGEDTGQAAIQAYSEGFSDLLLAMQGTEADLLGYLFQEYGAASDRKGQFFTPPHTARFLASMGLLGDSEPADSSPDDPITINDPTCGSGTLLVAASQQLEEIADSLYSALFCGQDIDPTCARMTAINFTVRGLPGFVIHGDSLAMDATAAWKIMPSKGLMGKPIRECEPSAFASRQGNDEPAGEATSTSEDNASAEEEAGINQQTQFSAFTDGGSDSQ